MRKSSDLEEPQDSTQFSQEKPVAGGENSEYADTAGGSVSQRLDSE